MEKDIKILKQFKEFLLTIGIPSCKFEKEISAIENTVNRLEQDERVIEEIIQEIEKDMKHLWVDTCAEHSGKYTAYRNVLCILEKYKYIED